MKKLSTLLTMFTCLTIVSCNNNEPTIEPTIEPTLEPTIEPTVEIGVGEKPKNWDLADYVLGKFSDQDKKMLEESLNNTIKATEWIVMDEIDEAMNLYNRKRTGKE